MTGLPPEAVGDAVGVLIYTFICLFCDALLIWLLWVHRERDGYVALIAYFIALCVVSSIVQQIYHYAVYEDVLWDQLDYMKAHYPNAEVIFKNGNFGFMLVLSNIRFFCYIIESTYLFTYTLHIALSMYGIWAKFQRAERIYLVLSKIIPLPLTAITFGLEYSRPVQRSWQAYMFVANWQAVLSCAFSIVLIGMVLYKYVEGQNLLKSVDSGPAPEGSSNNWLSKAVRRWKRKNPNLTSTQGSRGGDFKNSSNSKVDRWLVLRLSIAIVLISGFILATVLTHLGTPKSMGETVKNTAPDLTVKAAKSSIIGYIYGVTPGIAIPLVFGLRRPFKKTVYQTFVPKRWQNRDREPKPRKRAPLGSASSQERPDNRPPSPAVPVPEIPHGFEFFEDEPPVAMGKHQPIITRQEWSNNGMQPGAGDNLFELSAQPVHHEKLGVAPPRRPGSSGSGTSHNPLLRRSG